METDFEDESNSTTTFSPSGKRYAPPAGQSTSGQQQQTTTKFAKRKRTVSMSTDDLPLSALGVNQLHGQHQHQHQQQHSGHQGDNLFAAPTSSSSSSFSAISGNSGLEPTFVPLPSPFGGPASTSSSSSALLSGSFGASSFFGGGRSLDSESLLLGGGIGGADSLNNSLDAAYWHKFINTYVSFSLPFSSSLSLSLPLRELSSLVLVLVLVAVVAPSSPDGRGGYRDGDELERESQQATAEIMRNPFASSTPYTLQQDQGTLLRSALCLAHLSLSGSLSLTRDVRVWVWHGTHTHDR
jgi:hypothetical protein